MKPFWDPDTQLLAYDKLEHFGVALMLTLLFAALEPPMAAWFTTVIGAIGFELGQYDIARQFPATQFMAIGSLPRAFKPGYGVGWLDLMAALLGASVAAILLVV